MTTLPRGQEWTALALCAQVDPELWYPEKGGSNADAKAVCMRCPVRRECLDYALAHESGTEATKTSYPSGIFGGLSVLERRKLIRERAAEPIGLPATGTDGPACDEHAEQPTPKSYGLTYIGGAGHRPIPLATDIGVRPTHAPKTRRATGLDWSKHTAPTPEQATAMSWPCRGCSQKSSELDKGLCLGCRDAADARFTVPTAVPDHVVVEPQPVAPAPIEDRPAYVDDMVTVMVATEGHPDPTVRAARKAVANALVTLHKTLAQVFPHTPAAAVSSTRTTAAGPTRPKKPRPSRANPETDAAIVRLYTGTENLSCPQIADRLTIGVKAVRAALDRNGIERTDGRSTHSGGRPRTYDGQLRAEIARLYVDERMSRRQIAEHLDMPYKTVVTVMDRHHIPARQHQAGGIDGARGLKDRIHALGVTSRHIKAWALEQGLITVIKRGVVPTHLVDAYETAHPAHTEENPAR